MTSSRLSTLRAKVAAQNNQGRPVSPEPTTANGTTPGNALFDTPPRGSESTGVASDLATTGRGRRERRSTERGVLWAAERSRSQSRSARNRRTRKRNAARHKANRQANGEQTDPDQTDSEGDTLPTRGIAESPEPGSSDAEDTQGTQTHDPGSAQGTSGAGEEGLVSQFDKAGFLADASRIIGEDVTDRNTQDVQEMLKVLRQDQTPAMGTARRSSSIVLLPPAPIGFGGGWHRDRLGQGTHIQALESRTAKRTADTDGDDLRKRQRVAIPPENTDTEPETDDEPVQCPPSNPHPRSGTETIPETPTQPLTQTTVPDIQPDPLSPCPETSRSHSLGGSLVRRNSNSYLGLLAADRPRDATHARLRATLALRELANVEISGVDEDSHPNPSQPSHVGHHQRNTRTYGHARSHRGSGTQSERSSQPKERPQPFTRHPTDSSSQSASGSRSNARSDARAQVLARSRARPLPGARSQPSTQPTGSHSSLQPGQRRLDPVAQARADMVQFNRERANEHTTTLVQSVTRQTERTARSTARTRSPRRPHDLLPDDEEVRAHAAAIASGSHPPLARDSTGISRQILTLAKLHLFALALVEGIYQTRATFMHWAALVHEETWNTEVPDLPYVAATMSELEVMVNNVATLRGKAKERLRPLCRFGFGFRQPAVTQADIQHNLDLYALIHPNSFHCTRFEPRSGHYQSAELTHCIAAALFYGPSSVGVLYRDYFMDMPITTVAFVLALMQFCIEEWADGWFVSKDLGAGNMLEKYEAHLSGLKELRGVAPMRLQRMQDDWYEYAMDYSGASLVHDNPNQASTQRSEIRPDTPPIGHHNFDQIPSRSKGKGRADDESETSAPEDDVAPPSHTPSRSATPSIEFYDDGRISAQSKGKGRATD